MTRLPRRSLVLPVVAAVLRAPAACRRSEPRVARGPEAAPEGAVVVKLSYGSEKTRFLTESIEAFQRTSPRTAGDKPQRGEFRLGHTHPRTSSSGAVALVAATCAGAGKSRDPTTADVQKAAPSVRQVQARIVHSGRSTGFFAQKMCSRGPSYLSAAVRCESNVPESTIDPRFRDRAFDVVAICPREGTFWSHHPWAVLDLPPVTSEVREAAEPFRKFLMSPERQRAALTRFGFRPADPSDPPGAPIDAAHGLDPVQPSIVLPNPPVEVTWSILDSFEAVKRPVAVTFVLDTSGSMKGEPFRHAQAGAKVFLEGLPDHDHASVLLFSSSQRWVGKEHGRLGEVRPALAKALDESFAGGARRSTRPSSRPCSPRGRSLPARAGPSSRGTTPASRRSPSPSSSSRGPSSTSSSSRPRGTSGRSRRTRS